METLIMTFKNINMTIPFTEKDFITVENYFTKA